MQLGNTSIWPICLHAPYHTGIHVFKSHMSCGKIRERGCKTAIDGGILQVLRKPASSRTRHCQQLRIFPDSREKGTILRLCRSGEETYDHSACERRSAFSTAGRIPFPNLISVQPGLCVLPNGIHGEYPGRKSWGQVCCFPRSL